MTEDEWRERCKFYMDPEPPPVYERVLQYREGFYGRLPEVKDGAIGLSEHKWQGSDWLDVPIVSSSN